MTEPTNPDEAAIARQVEEIFEGVAPFGMATQREHAYWISRWLDECVFDEESLDPDLVPGVPCTFAWYHFRNWVAIPDFKEGQHGYDDELYGPFSGELDRTIFVAEMSNRFNVVHTHGTSFFVGICVSVL